LIFFISSHSFLCLFLSVDESKQGNLLYTLCSKLRFLTLSKAELVSITPFLQEVLSAEDLQAVQEAVETGDADKLPVGFSRSCLNRREPYDASPSDSEPDSETSGQSGENGVAVE
jgi:hypothetical protein